MRWANASWLGLGVRGDPERLVQDNRVGETDSKACDAPRLGNVPGPVPVGPQPVVTVDG